LFHPADLTKVEDIESFHRKIGETLHGIDVLVNNVGGISRFADFFELTDADWEASFNLNLMSAVRLTRLCLGALKNSGAPRIINISSIAAASPGEAFPHYSAMKAALSNLTGSLARTLAPHKILVNAISPGPVWTRSWENEAKTVSEKTGESAREARERIKIHTAETVPLRRMGVPEDVTGLALFLASDWASWITAGDFTVDGGIRQDIF
jgi:3-oxoacyl-[acyl-carrier protein] reductase